MKTVLFVTYGSGHVRMVVPVARALVEQGLARVQVLALTTAASVVASAGLPLLQFKNFVTPDDDESIAHGRRLLAGLSGPVADAEETVAYLGLCYAELVAELGPEAARLAYEKDGRQAFLPRRTLQRIVSQVAPDLVVATNSPRAERAAIMAARDLGLPSVCMVDLFCLDEVKWIGDPTYADRVCVLNPSVKDFLVSSGRDPAQVVVTGNPAFDTLADPAHAGCGSVLREASGWAGKRVLLWPTQVEPAFHPFDGRPADVHLPANALRQLMAWVMSRDDCVLCIRPRAGEAMPEVPGDGRIVVTPQDIPLADLLYAVDLVVTLNSTIGLEGHLAGTRLLQVLGSVFDDAMPLKAYGIADEAVHLQDLWPALERCAALPRRTVAVRQDKASTQVLHVLREFL